MFEKIRLYTFYEFFQLIKLSLARRLRASVPKSFIAMSDSIDLYLLKSLKISKENKNIKVEFALNDKAMIFSLRKNSSDMMVFNQIVLNHEYRAIIDLFKNKNLQIKNMIDAGANIGLTSLYFKAFFPNIKIIVLEPNLNVFYRMENNFNLNECENIFKLNKGLWGKNTILAPDISNKDNLDWAYKLVETKEETTESIEVVSMPSIIDLYQFELVDFLKIDIEGGEVSVFGDNSNLEWLKKVKIIALEIHDEFNCREDIEDKLENFGFKLTHSGELTIGVNQNLFEVN